MKEGRIVAREVREMKRVRQEVHRELYNIIKESGGFENKL